MARRVAIMAFLMMISACGGSNSAGGPAASPSSSASTSASTAPVPSAGVPAAGPHVFLIIMENRGYAEAMAQPYTASLAQRYAVATNYHAVSHPSLPNYLALTSGSTHGITDDGWHPLPAGGIGGQLTAHGISWRAYMEGMTGSCLNNVGRYALKHNPFPYYGGTCPPNVVSFATLDADLAGNTPSFVWITPDMCHDGHDCSSRQADDFLAGFVPKILASPAWQHDGLLLLTWDEDDGNSGNRVPMLVIAPNLTQHQTAVAHDHYSTLATIEDRLGVPRLGNAASATPVNELFA